VDDLIADFDQALQVAEKLVTAKTSS